MQEPRRIGIFMILWNNPFSQEQFEICRDYYNRLIQSLGLQVDIWGVEYQVAGQDELQPLTNKFKLHCRNEQEMAIRDKDTKLKWRDLVMSPILPQYDVYVRLTPSSVLNLVRFHAAIQSLDYDPEVVYTGAMYHQMVRHEKDGKEVQENHIFPRGNLVVMSRAMVEGMQEDFRTHTMDEIVWAGAGTNDDHIIGTLLFKYRDYKYRVYGYVGVNEATHDVVQGEHLMDEMLVGVKINGAGSNPPINLQQYSLQIMKLILGVWQSHFITVPTYKDTEPFGRNWWWIARRHLDEIIEEQGWKKPE